MANKSGSFGAGVNGSASPPGATSTVSTGKGPMETDAVGVAEGLSARSGFDTEEHGPTYNYERDALNGNATERPNPYEADSVKSKGKSFDVL